MTVQAQTLPADEALGALEPVVQFDGPMPTGVTVSHQGRIFVNFPKWGDDVTFTAQGNGLQPPFNGMRLSAGAYGQLFEASSEFSLSRTMGYASNLAGFL